MPDGAETDLASILAAQDANLAQATWHWPPSQRGRAYLHAITPNGEPRAFVKVWADGSERLQAIHEARLTEIVRAGLAGGYQVPASYGVAPVGAAPGLAAAWEPLPAESRPPYESEVRAVTPDAYRGDTRWVDRHDLDGLSWWTDLEVVTAASPSFRSALLEAVGDGLEVCLTHGDLGAANLAVAAGEVWIYDWETAAVDGPASVDRWTLTRGSAPDTTRAAAQGAAGSDRDAALVTIAFLAARGRESHQTLVRSWSR